jgi:hypothetical protein
MRVEDLESSSERYLSSSKIENARTITSYSWVDKAKSGPTILIPGKPPLWTPQKSPAPLKEDRGTYYRDKNAARYPKHPIEPAVVAALRSEPIIPAEVNLFACGSTLGNLLRFVRGQDKAFRMLVYLVENTIFLVRRENSPTEVIPDVRGFGHTFPEANTTWEADVRGSASHQRLIRYSFGGFDAVVRFEADGYIKPPDSPYRKGSPTTVPSTTTVKDLADSLEATSITPPTPSGQETLLQPQGLTIKTAGSLIPQSALFDLKTRGIKTRSKGTHMAEELPRLWVSQIPTFILAFHTNGLFKTEDIEIKDVRDDVTNWEEKHKKELACLAALLHRIRDMVKEQPGRKMELVHDGKGVLEVRKQLSDAGEVLSESVMEQWKKLREAGQGSRSSIPEDDEPKEGVDTDGDEDDNSTGGGLLVWDDGEDADYTACTADSCGYCGKCTY